MHRREVLSLLAAAPLVACTRRRSIADDALEVQVMSEPLGLDPRFLSDVYSVRISRLVHAPLVVPDEDTSLPRPWLAESIEWDGDAIVATLRKGAVFHDGTPVRARDVLATWAAYADPERATRQLRIVSELARVESLDGDDGRRVRFTPKGPRAVLPLDLDQPVMKADEATLPRGAKITATGPFVLLHAETGAVTLAPASAYEGWSGARARRPVVVRTVRDETARALRLIAGASDVAPNVLSPALARALPSRAEASTSLDVVQRGAAATTYLSFQLDHAPFDRLEVRRAIAKAIDRQALVDAFFAGAARIANGVLPPVLDLAPASPAAHDFDLAAARDVLAPLGRSGVRLSLVVLAQRGRVAVARAIAQMIGDAGVPVDVHSYELGTTLARLGAGSFDLALEIATELVDPEIWRWRLDSRMAPPLGVNRGRVRDAEIDALFDRGLATREREARAATYAELESRVHERAWLVPLWHEDHVAVVSGRAKGFVPDVDGRWSAMARVG